MAYKLIEEYKNILGGDPPFFVRSAVSPLFMVITWQEKVHPLHTFCIVKGRDSCISVNEKRYIAIATDKFRHYFKKEISIQELKNEYQTWETDTFKLYDEVTSLDLTKLSNEELQNYAIKVNTLCLELARRTIYIENVDYEKILSVTGSEYKDKLDAIWEKATETTFTSFEGRRLKKLLDYISSKPDNAIRKAKFIFTDYFWTKSENEIAHVLDELKQNFSEKVKEYEQMNAVAQNRKDKYESWLNTLDEDSKRIAEYAQLVMWMRDERKDPIAQIQAMLAELSVEMLQRAGIDTKVAPSTLLYEYMKGVDHLSSIKSDIEKRANGCIFIAYPDITYKIENCDFDSAIAQFEDLIEHKSEKVDVLKGQIACRGKAQGTVRVVSDPHIDKGFKTGDILVTSMTRPEFVPIMKKAAAVITNEGGITCHAAIVSRELNIPCIIGTKNATRVLNDGDMVEVDAEKGIVKILK